MTTVLYERPFDTKEELLIKPLGQVCVDSFPQINPRDSSHPRVTFTKLLLLLLFQLHVERFTSICQRTFPSTNHEMLYRGLANVPKTTARIRNCSEYHKHVRLLADMIEFTARSLEIELANPSRFDLTEFLLEIRSQSDQLARISQDNLDRYQHGWDAYREVLNVHESQGVKRLTMLATVFLPLSLSSSILAMSTRLVDLHLLLYDFVGVFLVLGSLALAFYAIITACHSIARWLEQQKQLSLFKMAKRTTTLRNAWDLLHVLLVWLGALYSFVLVAFWIGLTISFVIGMVKDVLTGLKFLGYYVALMIVMTIITAVVMLIYELRRAATRRAAKAAQPLQSRARDDIAWINAQQMVMSMPGVLP